MRIAVSYLSTIKAGLPLAVIKKTFADMESWNNAHGITGIILYSDGNFFQVVEGEREILAQVRNAIEKNSNHHNIIRIFEKEIHKEAFDGFKAVFVSAETKYYPEKIRDYTHQLEMLDEKTKQAAEKILKTFITSH